VAGSQGVQRSAAHSKKLPMRLRSHAWCFERKCRYRELDTAGDVAFEAFSTGGQKEGSFAPRGQKTSGLAFLNILFESEDRAPRCSGNHEEVNCTSCDRASQVVVIQ